MSLGRRFNKLWSWLMDRAANPVLVTVVAIALVILAWLAASSRL